jgi:tRNA(fMet)-specific endonuclease VapC
VHSTYPILGYGEHEADWHATERARLEAIGLKPGYADGQIAATAHVAKLTVITANVRDFKRFRVSVVDWRSIATI